MRRWIRFCFRTPIRALITIGVLLFIGALWKVFVHALLNLGFTLLILAVVGAIVARLLFGIGKKG